MAEAKKPKPRSQRMMSLTPEEQISRALRARYRFKALIRFIIQNLYWLTDLEDQELGDDVQKNVFLLTRRKNTKTLTLMDKFILSKPPDQRTEQEKLHLDRVIGGLSSFRRYPRHVKSQLAGVTCFAYFGPGRTIIRQGHESEAFYFIVTGEVSILQETFDTVLKENVTLTLGTSGPGSGFGEVSLLHNIPRTATIVTNTHCEFLCLKRDDFNAVLKETVQQAWNNIENAMKLFSYFNNWDEISSRECCILSKLQWYTLDETILGDGIGFPDYVYFILNGRCQVVENLQVSVCYENGIKLYKLFDPLTADSISTISKTRSAQGSATHTDREKRGKASLVSRTGEASSKRRMSGSLKSNTPVVPFLKSINSSFKHEDMSDSQTTNVSLTSRQKFTRRLCAESKPAKVEAHFMQVCLLNPTACFGIGENMVNRRVVAQMPTQCLLIPRYWLMQKGNIWHTVRHYVINHIPTTKQIFQEFVKNRKWLQYRQTLFKDLIKRKLPCINSTFNIPYYIRIHSEDFV